MSTSADMTLFNVNITGNKCLKRMIMIIFSSVCLLISVHVCLLLLPVGNIKRSNVCANLGNSCCEQRKNVQSFYQSYIENARDIPEQNFKIEIKVLTYNRYFSIKRCLAALEAAEYGNDKVDIQVFLDHFPVKENMDSKEYNEKLALHNKILDMIRSFKWSHGKMDLFVREENGNLQTAWLEAFYPLDNNTYAFIVEDDIQVSPFYYMYLRKLITKYRYSGDIDPNIYGISFQRHSLVPGYWSFKSVNVDNDEQPYLYQLVGTWGQIVFPEHWREFREYYDQRMPFNDLKPRLEGMVTDKWYQQKGEKIWTPWFIRFVYAKNYYCLYTNFPGRKSLSTSHRDSGENYKLFSRGADSDLITYQDLEDIELFKKHFTKPLVESGKLRRFDYCFQEVMRGKMFRLQHKEPALSNFIKSNRNYALIFTDFDSSEKYWKNQLCFLEQHTPRSTEAKLKEMLIFITKQANVAHELVYRGYNTIYLEDGLSELDAIKLVSKAMTPSHMLFLTTTERKLIKDNPLSDMYTSSKILIHNRGPSHEQWLTVPAKYAANIAFTGKQFSSFLDIVSLFTSEKEIVTQSAKSLSGTIQILSQESDWNKGFSLIREDDLACRKINCWR